MSNVQTTTWPTGLDRPTLTVPARPARPLPHTVRLCCDPRDPDIDSATVVPVDSPVRVSHMVSWCVGGIIGWAGILTAGWLAMDVLGRLLR